MAIDEVQLAGDLERGHVFTDRILNLRGREETLVLGAATMRVIVERLPNGISVVTRPRLPHEVYGGQKKITRSPQRSRSSRSRPRGVRHRRADPPQRGGAAVVLGALSPRTRNAQVAIYQAGEVDYLVATDAIGMGLNLDVDHVAFARSASSTAITRRWTGRGLRPVPRCAARAVFDRPQNAVHPSST